MRSAKEYKELISEKISVYNRQINLLDSFIRESESIVSKSMSNMEFGTAKEYNTKIEQYKTERRCFEGARNILSEILG